MGFRLIVSWTTVSCILCKKSKGKNKQETKLSYTLMLSILHNNQYRLVHGLKMGIFHTNWKKKTMERI